MILFGLGLLMGFWCGVAAAVTWEAYLETLYGPRGDPQPLPMTPEEREKMQAVREEWIRGRR